MRRYLLLASVALFAACGGSTATGTTGTVTPATPESTTPVVTTSVSMANITFTPANIQVVPGAIVTFTNNDAITHNVTFANATVGTTGNYSTGTKTLTMPAAAGTYSYKCTIHGSMTGVVTVK